MGSRSQGGYPQRQIAKMKRVIKRKKQKLESLKTQLNQKIFNRKNYE